MASLCDVADKCLLLARQINEGGEADDQALLQRTLAELSDLLLVVKRGKGTDSSATQQNPLHQTKKRDFVESYGVSKSLASVMDESGVVRWNVERTPLGNLIGAEKTKQVWENVLSKPHYVAIVICAFLLCSLGLLLSIIFSNELGMIICALVIAVWGVVSTLYQLDGAIAYQVMKEESFQVRFATATSTCIVYVLLHQRIYASTALVAIGVWYISVMCSFGDAMSSERRVIIIPSLIISLVVLISLLVTVNNGLDGNVRNPTETRIYFGTFSGISNQPLETNLYGWFNESVISLCFFLVGEIRRRWVHRRTKSLVSITVSVLGGDDLSWSPPSVLWYRQHFRDRVSRLFTRAASNPLFSGQVAPRTDVEMINETR